MRDQIQQRTRPGFEVVITWSASTTYMNSKYAKTLQGHYEFDIETNLNMQILKYLF